MTIGELARGLQGLMDGGVSAETPAMAFGGAAVGPGGREYVSVHPLAIEGALADDQDGELRKIVLFAPEGATAGTGDQYDG